VKNLRRQASLAARDPEDIIFDNSPHIARWTELNTPVPIRMDLTPPPKGLASRGLLHREELVIFDDITLSKFQPCFQDLRRVTRILIRHARNLRRIRYGKTLIRLFIKKSSVALKSILFTTGGVTDTPSVPTDVSVVRDETTGCLITTAPEEVVDKITQMETAALSPDPALPPGGPFSLTRTRPPVLQERIIMEVPHFGDVHF
jgi:hypothetical protein